MDPGAIHGKSSRSCQPTIESPHRDLSKCPIGFRKDTATKRESSSNEHCANHVEVFPASWALKGRSPARVDLVFVSLAFRGLDSRRGYGFSETFVRWSGLPRGGLFPAIRAAGRRFGFAGIELAETLTGRGLRTESEPRARNAQRSEGAGQVRDFPLPI